MENWKNFVREVIFGTIRSIKFWKNLNCSTNKTFSNFKIDYIL